MSRPKLRSRRNFLKAALGVATALACPEALPSPKPEVRWEPPFKNPRRIHIDPGIYFFPYDGPPVYLAPGEPPRRFVKEEWGWRLLS